MSADGNPQDRPFDCHDLRVAVVAASWHEKVMAGLLDGALDALKRHQVEQPVVVRVPGSFELPVVADALAKQGFDERIYVRADKLVDYGRVASVMSTITAAGFKRVALVTEPAAR